MAQPRTPLIDRLEHNEINAVLYGEVAPYRHQADALHQLLASTIPHWLILGAPGTGKTLLAARLALAIHFVLRRIGTQAPMIYATPPSVLRQLEAELARFAPTLRVHGVRTRSEVLPPVRSYDVLPISTTLPIGAGAARLREQLNGLAPLALLIVDEVHLLRTVSTKRTQFWAALGLRAARVLLMTGTSLVNSAMDVFVPITLLRLRAAPGMGVPDPVNPQQLRPISLAEFQARYTVTRLVPIGQGRTIERIVGSQNLDALHQVITPQTIRWKLSDLHDLPRLRIEPVYLDVLDVLDRLIDSGVSVATITRMRQLATSTDPREQQRLWTVLSAEAGALAAYRRLIGAAKVEQVADLAIDDHQAGGGRQLVFFHHRHVGETLVERLRQAGLKVDSLYGGVAAGTRDARVRDFTTGQLDALVVQIDTGGIGLNLQSANRVLFSECPWTDSAFRQAIARAHRAGQQRPVLARLATVAGSLDSAIIALMRTKALAARILVDGTDASPDITMRAAE